MSPWITRNRCLPLLAPAILIAALACSDQTDTLTAPEAEAVPAPALGAASSPLPFRQISSGFFHTCGVTTSDQAYCWGNNTLGQLGMGSRTGPEGCDRSATCSTRPVAVVGGLRFRSVSAGADHSCAVTYEDKAYCWGGNSSGALGDGTYDLSSSPVAVAGGLHFRQISVGWNHTCAVTTDDLAYCWGRGSRGLLGNGSEEDRNAPVAVAGGLHFRALSAGGEFTCAITTTNRAYCWGSNFDGQLGDSTKVEFRTVPGPVSGGRSYRQIDAGGYHACALNLNSQAFCWGDGRVGQLGNGKTVLSRWPRRVLGGLTFDRVDAGTYHTCGETGGNRVYCWGYNSHGQLGDGTTTTRTTPVLVSGNVGFAHVSAGGYHTCGTTPTFAGYCWGRNMFGALGDGTLSKHLIPKPVLGPS
jgi:alpha-tubulin suppressor-like RCC1 family protein